MTPWVWIAVVFAFSLSAGLPIVVKPILRRLRVVDVPNHRSSHTENVLRGGGIAVLVGISAGLAIAISGESAPAGPADLSPLVFGLVVVVGIGVVGAIEDFRGLPIAARVVFQLTIGAAGSSALTVTAGVPLWCIPVGAVFFAAYTNAANFMDGIDTLSSMHGLTAGGVLALVGGLSSLPWLVALGLTIGVSFAAFLPWNLGPNKMFLGDVGSYVLGGSIAFATIAAAISGVPIVTLLGPLAVYLVDTGTTLVLRVARGERWQEAHRSHVYQRLVIPQFSHIKVSLIVTVMTIVSSGFGLLGLSRSATATTLGVFGILGVAAIYLALPRLLKPVAELSTR